MIKDECFVLNNGVKIPKIGLGTWQISNEDATPSVLWGLEYGYRHIDTAEAYGNEVGVGLGIKQSGLRREDIFITSKIHAHIKTYEEAKAYIEQSLKDLDVDYIDLMLIHAPRPWNILWDPNAPRMYKENVEVYRAMEEAYKEGKLKSIGLSNFYIDDVRNILEHCEIVPQVNQICIFIGNTPMDVIDYCKENNILVEAYSPIATGRLLNNELVKSIADKYGVSVARLCIRYCLEIDTLPLPKSNKENHIRENIDVDFEISKEDMELLLKQ